MNLEDLKNIDIKDISTREGVRKIGAGLAMGVVVLMAVWFFFIRTAASDIRAMEGEMEEARQQLQTDQKVIEEGEEIKRNHRRVKDKLTAVMENKLVPSRAALSWVSLHLQAVAAETGVEVYDQAGDFASPSRQDRDAEPFLLQHFAARFNMRGDYHQIGHFIAGLEQRIPFAVLQNLSISPERQRDEGKRPRLTASVVYKFPRFTEEGFPSAKRP